MPYPPTNCTPRLPAIPGASVLFKTGIRKGSAVPESTIAAVPVVRYAKKSNPSVDYMQLWNEIKQRLAKKEADE